MTVQVQTPYTSTDANGVTTSFPFNFKCFDEEDLTITLDGAVQTTGFTVTGIGVETGGSVVFDVAPADGVKVLVANNTIPKRDTNYPQYGAFPADIVNKDFDRLWVAIQYLLQKISTAVKLPFDTDVEPLLTQDATARALKYLGFDVTGAITIADIPDLAATLAAKEAAELAAATIDGFENVGAYAGATVYYKNNLIRSGGNTYVCLADPSYTSTGVAADDVTAGNLAIFAQKGDAGAGAGDLVAANNLSELTATAATVRANLGILSAALKAAGNGADQLPTSSQVYGLNTIWIPAGAMKPRLTAGPSSGSVETATNKVMISTLDFDYATQDEFAQFAIRMPKSWDEGAVQAEFVWSSAAAASAFGVVWGIQARASGDGDALDLAFSTAVLTTDTGSSTGDLLRKTAMSGDVTPAGTPAAGDVVIFQVYRDFDHASDTMDKDARLHGVMLTYTTDALNDA